MALELIKEEVMVSRVFGRDTLRTVIENDLIVPDSKADIGNITIVDADVFIQKIEPSKDKVNIKGVLRYKIIYTEDNEERKIVCITSDVEMSEELNAQGCTQEMLPRLKCSIEHVGCNLLNGRKVNLKAVTAFSLSIKKLQVFDVLNDIDGMDDVQLLRETIDVNAFKGSTLENFVVRESLEVPAGKPSITDILRNDVRIGDVEYQTTDNKLIVKGNANITTLYLSEDEDIPVQHMEHDVPFSQFVDLEGAEDNATCDAIIRIRDVSFSLEENTDDEQRVIEAYIDIEVDAQAYENREISVISDAYSPTRQVTLNKRAVEHDTILSKIKRQGTMRETLLLKDESVGMKEILHVKAYPSISDYSLSDGIITVEGSVRCSVIYVGDNESNDICGHEQDILFKQELEYEDTRQGADYDIDVDIDYVTYSLISSNEIEVRISIDLTANAFFVSDVPAIENADERSELEEVVLPYSVMLYFARPGDNLWSVAKKYRTTMDEIEVVNDMDQKNPLTPGQQILIPLKKH